MSDGFSIQQSSSTVIYLFSFKLVIFRKPCGLGPQCFILLDMATFLHRVPESCYFSIQVPFTSQEADVVLSNPDCERFFFQEEDLGALEVFQLSKVCIRGLEAEQNARFTR